MSKPVWQKTISLTRKELEDFNRYQSMWTGISLTPEQIVEVGGDDFCEELQRNGGDTGDREVFMSLLANSLVGEDWPTYGQLGSSPLLNSASAAHTSDNFSYRLRRAAKKKGYKLLLQKPAEKFIDEVHDAHPTSD